MSLKIEGSSTFSKKTLEEKIESVQENIAASDRRRKIAAVKAVALKETMKIYDMNNASIADSIAEMRTRLEYREKDWEQTRKKLCRLIAKMQGTDPNKLEIDILRKAEKTALDQEEELALESPLTESFFTNLRMPHQKNNPFSEDPKLAVKRQAHIISERIDLNMMIISRHVHQKSPYAQLIDRIGTLEQQIKQTQQRNLFYRLRALIIKIFHNIKLALNLPARLNFIQRVTRIFALSVNFRKYEKPLVYTAPSTLIESHLPEWAVGSKFSGSHEACAHKSLAELLKQGHSIGHIEENVAMPHSPS
jgi:hypothetical protein